MAEFDHQIASVLFLLYVRVADVDKSIGLRDIEKFDRLMDQPQILNLPLLSSGLEQLRTNYSQLWTSYRKGLLGKENEEITVALDALDLKTKGDTWLEWRDAFIKFVNYFAVDSGLASKILSKQDLRKNRMDQVGLITLLIMNWKPISAKGMLSKDIGSLETSEVLSAVSKSIKNVLLAVNASAEQVASNGIENQHLICVDVHHLNEDVATYTFAAQRQRLWAFKPGQFLTFDIPHEESWIRRSYSISSSPSQPYFLDVTVKKLPGGYVSNWFHEHMKVGKEVIARGPHGNFSLFEAKREKLLFMAAGVGITPIISMLRWLVDTRAPNDVIVFNRVHSHEDTIFINELAELENRSKGRIRVITMSTMGHEHWPASLNVLDGSRTGFISPETISFLAGDLQERDVFLCGPDSFIEDIKQSLAKLDFNLEHLHYESFGGLNNSARSENSGDSSVLGSINTAARFIAADIPEELQCKVEFKRSGKTVICQKGDNLLEVAEFYGIEVDNSCRMGSCGSCKCTKVSGDVLLSNSDGLSEAEKASNHVLLCVGSANSSTIVLDV